jgi:hypothetical protein
MTTLLFDDERTPEVAPVIRRGAEDQAAAYEALLAQWADADAGQDERDWQRVQAQLQDTRRATGQRLLSPE